MAIVANEVRYVVTLDGSKDVSLLSISNKFWNRGIPAHALSPHLRLPPTAGSVSGGGDVPFRATCPPPPPRSPEAEKANGEMSAAILRGESEAVARLVAEGNVQTDFTNDHGEGWLHLAARAYRGDPAICMTYIIMPKRCSRYLDEMQLRAHTPLALFQFSPSFHSATSMPAIWLGRTPWEPPSPTSATSA